MFWCVGVGVCDYVCVFFDVVLVFYVLNCSWLIYLVTLLGVIISCCAVWVYWLCTLGFCDLFCVLMCFVYFICVSFVLLIVVCLVCFYCGWFFIWVSLVIVGVLLLG